MEQAASCERKIYELAWYVHTCLFKLDINEEGKDALNKEVQFCCRNAFVQSVFIHLFESKEGGGCIH